MLIRQDGLFALLGTAKRDPYSKDVLVASLKPVTEFGFLKVLQELSDEAEGGPGKPKVTTTYKKTFYKYGRNVMELEQTIDNPHDMKVSRRTMLFDIDLLIPIERAAYGPNGELQYKYIYRDLRFNTGLTSSDFTPEANGLKG
jgi:outer membrane lipoprotein-sorting protein